MEWFYPKRRGPEWKQRGLTAQTRSSVSAPSIHLLMIFGVVVCLLWFSQYSEYKAQLHQTAINLQLFLLLLPILLIFFVVSYFKQRKVQTSSHPFRA
ncbi:hypothetical protein L6164_037594 [Bauhinia variegata]|uniref:Uncharacterized protein n=1 Tax=Bauhinia variegata TaxID=167791 RepID=A0ACB9KKG3_BAUVA|nr:hypothetical protein L6164_037594 [Bauhinia variegata]